MSPEVGRGKGEKGYKNEEKNAMGPEPFTKDSVTNDKKEEKEEGGKQAEFDKRLTGEESYRR